MDLFEYARTKTMQTEAPLASRIRPRTLDEVVGQQHIIGRDKLLYRAIRADKLSSLIFYGPPGTGKTTLARVIANTTKSEFTQINATVAGKKDMEAVVKEAKENLGMYGKKTILFIDEIHRFNKGQQDYLLPFVEDGTLILIGATTENPYFEVNGALLSRSVIFELKPLQKEDIKKLLQRAVTDTERGMGAYHAVLEDEAADFLADVAGGDARAALNAVELGVLTTQPSADGRIHITLDVASECIQKRAVRYAGEDIKFIARRIMICAAEDVGPADPQALQVAVAASLAAERIGLPEAQLILSEAAIYVATAPKSNSATEAIFAAMRAVKERPATIPTHLQDAHYGGASKLGRGIGYEYAHDFPKHFSHQQYLPDELVGEHFYEPSENGYEKQIRKYLDWIHED